MTKVSTAIAAMFLAAPLVFAAQTNADRKQEQEDTEWVAGIGRPRAYADLMPLNVPGLRAAYRFETDNHWADMEQYFAIAIGMPPSRNLEATFMFPVGASIPQQLFDSHRESEQGSAGLGGA